MKNRKEENIYLKIIFLVFDRMELKKTIIELFLADFQKEILSPAVFRKVTSENQDFVLLLDR